MVPGSTRYGPEQLHRTKSTTCHHGLRLVQRGRNDAGALMHEPRHQRDPTRPTDQEDRRELPGTETGRLDGDFGQLGSPPQRSPDELFQILARDVGVRERRWHGHVGVRVPRQRFLGATHVLPQHPSAPAIRQLTSLDELFPRLGVRLRHQGTDVFQKGLVYVRAPESRVTSRGEYLVLGALTGLRSPDDADVDGATTEVQNSHRVARITAELDRAFLVQIVGGERRGVEPRRRHRLGHQRHLVRQLPGRLPQQPRANRTPVGGMRQYQQRNLGVTRESARLGHRTLQHSAHGVHDGEHRVSEEEFTLVYPTFRMRFESRGIDSGLPFGLLAHEQRAVPRRVNGGRRSAAHPQPRPVVHDRSPATTQVLDVPKSTATRSVTSRSRRRRFLTPALCQTLSAGSP